MAADIDPGAARVAKSILLDIMSREHLSLDDAEKRAVERYDNAIVFDQAKMALRQEEEEPEPPKTA